MSDALMVAIVTTIPTAMVASIALVQLLKNSTRLTEIHTLTNSNFSRVIAALETSQAHVAALEDSAATLALSVAAQRESVLSRAATKPENR